METDEAPSNAVAPSSNEADADMQDAKAAANASGAENSNPESGDKPVQMETDNKVTFFIIIFPCLLLYISFLSNF